jgi:hypothetical protein
MSFERLRAGINRALKTMRAGEIPGQPLASRYGVPPEILAPFDIPYRAALDAAIEARCTEIAQTPIDDAAWEESCSGAATLRPGSGNSRSTALDAAAERNDRSAVGLMRPPRSPPATGRRSGR